MQTFLPFADFTNTAMTLDLKRLNSQVNEGLVIAAAALSLKRNGEEYEPNPGKIAWANHPATTMWKGHVNSLIEYTIICLSHFRLRTFKSDYIENDTRYNRLLKLNDKCWEFGLYNSSLPVWIGDEDFHRSHQSNLIRKDPEYYSRFFPDIPADLPYVWPKSETVE